MKKKLILIFTIFISMLFITTLNALTPEEFYNMSEAKRQEALNGMDGKSRLEFLSEYETYKKELEKNALTTQEFYNMTEEERQNALSEMDGKTKQEFLAKYNAYVSNLKNSQKNDNTSSDKNNSGGNSNNTSSGSNNSSNGSNSGSSGASLNGWCSKFNSVWFILGRILQVIYVATPLLLIVTGAITFLQAMTNKDSGAVKKAEQTLIKKIIAAVLIFLLLPITKLSLKLVADEGWYDCAKCVFSPDESCKSGDVTTG